MNIKKQFLVRVVIGGALGAAGYLLVSFLARPGAVFGGSPDFAFTFCFDGRVPEGLGAALGLALWFAFGAEVAVATLPFADSGWSLVLRSLAHFAVMAVTVGAWAWLNFGLREVLFFLIPLLLVYLLIWLGRWVGWYAEVAAIREKLGLAPGPSPLKWKETLPYFGFAFLLCLVLPLVLRAFDAADVPVLSALYGWLLLPVGGFFSGLSLGKRHGFCPLYPVACGVFILLLIPLARLFSNMADGVLIPVAAAAALLGDLAGAGYVWAKRKRKEREIK